MGIRCRFPDTKSIQHINPFQFLHSKRLQKVMQRVFNLKAPQMRKIMEIEKILTITVTVIQTIIILITLFFMLWNICWRPACNLFNTQSAFWLPEDLSCSILHCTFTKVGHKKLKCNISWPITWDNILYILTYSAIQYRFCRFLANIYLFK